MHTPVVRFVVDRKIDVQNHLIALRAYQRMRAKDPKTPKNDALERLARLSPRKQKGEIEKQIAYLYKRAEKLESLAKDINMEWQKIEGRVLRTLEKIHDGHPFPMAKVRGILSAASRFGYNKDERWFTVNVFRNKFAAIDTALHELMHFMFHTYYDKECRKLGLSPERMWDVKESFSVLVNSELGEFRFQPDAGYPSHKKMRAFIEKVWLRKRNFTETLRATVAYANRPQNK